MAHPQLILYYNNPKFATHSNNSPKDRSKIALPTKLLVPPQCFVEIKIPLIPPTNPMKP